jgi:hypothetical protein
VIPLSHPDSIVDVVKQSLACPAQTESPPRTHQGFLPENRIIRGSFGQEILPAPCILRSGLNHHLGLNTSGPKGIEVLQDPKTATRTDRRILDKAKQRKSTHRDELFTGMKGMKRIWERKGKNPLETTPWVCEGTS